MKNRPDRRTFLQQLGAGTALAALGLGNSLFASSAEEKGPQPRHFLQSSGEDFWTQLRNEFNLGPQIYLNTGTLGLMSKTVLAEVNRRMEILSGGAAYGVEDDIRQAVARLFGAQVSEISLTHNTTEGINIIAAGLRLRKGEEVIMTDQEHVGNALPWLNRARLEGIRIRVLSPASTAAETLNRLDALITRRTRVFALPHITCTSGHVLPAKEIADLARSRGIISFFDGAHGPGMLFPNVAEIGCDFYAACGHKWLCGPAGTGMLYLRKEAMERVEALMVGAYSDTGWEISQEKQTLDPLIATAHRYDYGTQNSPVLAGLREAITFMEEIGLQKIKERVSELGGYLQSKLLERNYLEMLTPQEAISRSGMIGFKLKGKSLKDIEQSDLYRRFRLRLVPESGLDSVRVSCHIYTSHGELDELMAEMDRFMMI